MVIESTRNPKIQRVKALLSQHKERQEQGCFVLEGSRLIEEAISAGARPEVLLFSGLTRGAENLVQEARAAGAEVYEVKPSILDAVSDTQTSQGLVGIFRIPELVLPEKLDFVLILDGLSDPGNLGTILRTASAGGVQWVIISSGTTDVYAPKVVRSAMGAHFYLPIRRMDWDEIKLLKQEYAGSLHFLASDVSAGKSCWDSDLKRPIALIIGNEARGISQQAMRVSDERIHIPMQGKIESLNASTAASILIFEVVRQRTS